MESSEFKFSKVNNVEKFKVLYVSFELQMLYIKFNLF